MEKFWIAFILASLIIAGATLWLLKWLKLNYPQAYENDPVMASLGGVAALSMIASSKLQVEEPFNFIIGMLPIYIIVCFLLSPEYVKRFKYIGLVALAMILTVSISNISGLGNWFVYSSAFIVFACLWGLLFRVRYVLIDNN